MSNIYVLTGPSFSGKSTVASQLGYPKMLTSTTRVPRNGEVHGVHYSFLSRGQFETGIKNEDFIEHAVYWGNYYGTSVESVQTALETGEIILNVMEMEGTMKLKSLYPNQVTTIFLSADLETLLERANNREDAPEVIQSRIESLQQEISQAYLCDISIKNEDIEKTLKIIRWLIDERI